MYQITVKSLLKDLHPIKGFVYASVRRDSFVEDVILAEVRARAVEADARSADGKDQVTTDWLNENGGLFRSGG